MTVPMHTHTDVSIIDRHRNFAGHSKGCADVFDDQAFKGTGVKLRHRCEDPFGYGCKASTSQW
jgi:hypothetical protein